MKKYNLLKMLGICFLIVFVLSWIIPIATYDSGTFTAGVISQMGFFELLRLPLAALSNYIPYGIFVLAIGGLYGVMNKTGVYSKLVKAAVDKFKKNEKNFLIYTVVGFALLSALSGSTLVLFILVPLFISILLLMNYSRLEAIAATAGAIIVGSFASLYGFNISGYINYFFTIDVNKFIFLKVILFVVAVGLLLYAILKANKHDKAEKKLEIPLYDKAMVSDKSYMPLLILLGVSILFLLVATFNWRYGLNVTVFDSMYESIMSFKLGGVTIFKNVLGSINAIGYWGIEETIIILVILSAVLSWLYNLKINDAIESFVDGAKEMLAPAFYIILANIIISIMIGGATTGNMSNTVAHYFLTLSTGFNIFTTSLTAIFGGLFFNDLTYIISYMSANITKAITDTTVYPVIGMIYQTTHALLMLVLPTSLILIAGLSYLKVSYIDWIKYIWKYVLELLAVAAVVIIIVSLLV